ncbi:MAG: 23S rRNA pseudouridine(2604) synthase RluF [Porticoccaceae bacterium]|nr:23S rRNA pseudouridine(2604) synthase RluF [Porticoccaceae bacterium]
MPGQSSTRLNKYISESGICSRREADRYVEQGNVYINGKRAQIGDQVFPGDAVKVNGQAIEPQDAEEFIFIALNKPVGVVSTTESNERNNIVDFVGHSTRIFPVGRLDKDSQGLIFLTSNGDLVNKILRAGNKHEKEYLVTVNKPLSDDFLAGISAGVPMLGVITKKCKVSKVSPRVFNITLVQGLNRQIRRMCEHFGYEAVKLERVRIMNVGLKGLPVGEWRDLTEEELRVLLKAAEGSSSEAAPGKKARSNSGKSSGKASRKAPGKASRKTPNEAVPAKKARSNSGKRPGKPLKKKTARGEKIAGGDKTARGQKTDRGGKTAAGAKRSAASTKRKPHRSGKQSPRR